MVGHCLKKHILMKLKKYMMKMEHWWLCSITISWMKKERMMIALFEVFKQYRNRGGGKRIIAQFLQDYYGEINLEPSSEESESFWKQCGFESGCYLDRRCK